MRELIFMLIGSLIVIASVSFLPFKMKFIHKVIYVLCSFTLAYLFLITYKVFNLWLVALVIVLLSGLISVVLSKKVKEETEDIEENMFELEQENFSDQAAVTSEPVVDVEDLNETIEDYELNDPSIEGDFIQQEDYIEAVHNVEECSDMASNEYDEDILLEEEVESLKELETLESSGDTVTMEEQQAEVEAELEVETLFENTDITIESDPESTLIDEEESTLEDFFTEREDFFAQLEDANEDEPHPKEDVEEQLTGQNEDVVVEDEEKMEIDHLTTQSIEREALFTELEELHSDEDEPSLENEGKQVEDITKQEDLLKLEDEQDLNFAQSLNEKEADILTNVEDSEHFIEQTIREEVASIEELLDENEQVEIDHAVELENDKAEMKEKNRRVKNQKKRLNKKLRKQHLCNNFNYTNCN
ncbi:MAG: hypothetical protein LRY71_14925 [Bacillaceae bacterium]|nr:hypothetical protein [Bacillaceae bacterium]